MSARRSRTVLDHPEQITRYRQQIQMPRQVGKQFAAHRDRAAVRIARSLNLSLVATRGVSYVTLYKREVLDIFTEGEQA